MLFPIQMTAAISMRTAKCSDMQRRFFAAGLEARAVDQKDELPGTGRYRKADGPAEMSRPCPDADGCRLQCFEIFTGC